VLFVSRYVFLCHLVRLAESNRNALAGRLEVYNYRNGIWGTVCNDRFNDTAAKVVCNSLGFGYVVPIVLKKCFLISQQHLHFLDDKPWTLHTLTIQMTLKLQTFRRHYDRVSLSNIACK